MTIKEAISEWPAEQAPERKRAEEVCELPLAERLQEDVPMQPALLPVGDGTRQTKCMAGLPPAASNMTLHILNSQRIVDKANRKVICDFFIQEVHTGNGPRIENIFLFSPDPQGGESVLLARLARFNATALKECVGDIMKIYTFEPNYVGQPATKTKGPNREPMYSWGRFKQSCCGAEYWYMRYNEENVLSQDPCLMGYAPEIRSTMIASAFLCGIPMCCAKFGLELHHPDCPEEKLIIIDDKKGTIEVAAGVDVLEAACLYCAFITMASLR